MTPIAEIVKKYGSQGKCAKANRTSQSQVFRWVKAGAMVDDDGNVWIKTKGEVLTPDNLKWR